MRTEPEKEALIHGADGETIAGDCLLTLLAQRVKQKPFDANMRIHKSFCRTLNTTGSLRDVKLQSDISEGFNRDCSNLSNSETRNKKDQKYHK